MHKAGIWCNYHSLWITHALIFYDIIPQILLFSLLFQTLFGHTSLCGYFLSALSIYPLSINFIMILSKRRRLKYLNLTKNLSSLSRMASTKVWSEDGAQDWLPQAMWLPMWQVLTREMDQGAPRFLDSTEFYPSQLGALDWSDRKFCI